MAESPLVFAGSGSNLALTKGLVDMYSAQHPAFKIDIPPSLGSAGAIRAARDGAISVGLISRPLQEDELHFGLTVVPYARTAVVLATHPSVAEDNITAADIVDIYTKRRTTWRDGQEIVVFTRQPGDSMTITLEQGLAGFKDAYAESLQAKRWRVLFTGPEMNRLLVKTPYALGISDLGTILSEHLPLKVLQVNGIPATPETIEQGRYPLITTLAFVFRQATLSPAAREFMAFVQSAPGQQIIRAQGYVPSN